MTREQLNKHWELIEAYKNGAEIEFKNGDGDWESIDAPVSSFYTEYRIKPAPECIPFDFSDAEFLIGKMVKAKVADFVCMITACNMPYCISGDTVYMYGELLSNFTFLDESPCGKLKQ
jgi:hypothetical protein